MVVVQDSLLYYWNPKAANTGGKLGNIAPSLLVADANLTGASVDSNGVLLLAGNTQNVTIPHRPEFLKTANWSVEFLFEPVAPYVDGSKQLWRSVGGGSTNGEGWVYRSPGYAEIYYDVYSEAGVSADVVTSVGELKTLQPIHLSIVCDGVDVKTYINGVIDETTVLGAVSFKKLNSPIIFNDDASAMNLNWRAFRFYDKTLSASEVQANFVNGGEIGMEVVDNSPMPTPAFPPDITVVANSETAVFANGSGDIADSPIIWYNEINPSESLVLGTNKSTSGGIGVYNLDGTERQFLAIGACNNVDIRSGVFGDRTIVVTTNRTNNSLTFAWLDPATRLLTLADSVLVGFEPYGGCLYLSEVNGDLYAFVTENSYDNGQFDQYRITASGNTVSGTKVRDMTTPSLSEGIAVQDSTGYLFLAEEDMGIYRYNAEPTGGNTRIEIDSVYRGGGGPVQDVEGVTIAEGRSSDEGYIIVSSQGDSSYHVYNLKPPHAWRKRFTIVANGGVDGTNDSDGIAVMWKPMGPLYPNGLMVAHDGQNSGGTKSNFKFVDLGFVLGDVPIGSVPAQSKIGDLRSSANEIIPIFSIDGYETKPLRITMPGGTGYIETVDTSDPAASNVRTVVNSITVALKKEI